MSGIQTYCRVCGKKYGGDLEGHCVVCHETFSSDSAFDKHLVSLVTAGCKDPRTLLNDAGNPVFKHNDRRDLWTVIKYNKDGTVRSHWKAPAVC